jgi:hypothetical protein
MCYRPTANFLGCDLFGASKHPNGLAVGADTRVRFGEIEQVVGLPFSRQPGNRARADRCRELQGLSALVQPHQGGNAVNL